MSTSKFWIDWKGPITVPPRYTHNIIFIYCVPARGEPVNPKFSFDAHQFPEKSLVYLESQKSNSTYSQGSNSQNSKSRILNAKISGYHRFKL